MMTLAAHATQERTGPAQISISFHRLTARFEAVLQWYRHLRQERALGCLSGMELKDIGYPTACLDGSAGSKASMRH